MLDYRDFLDAFPPAPELDGGGSLLAPFFLGMMPARRFAAGFEWCAGPGFIGLWLLANGAVARMTFADINPAAVQAAEHAAGVLGLAHRCRFHLSDNLTRVPWLNEPQFDLVVGNPPNYYAIPTEGALGMLRERDSVRLRGQDAGLAIHASFYRSVGPWLAPRAQLFISEVDPWAKEVVLPGVGLWDRRPEAPLETFRGMVEDAGLVWLGCVPFSVDGEVQLGMVRAAKP
jgi:hypothetical protein